MNLFKYVCIAIVCYGVILQVQEGKSYEIRGQITGLRKVLLINYRRLRKIL